MRIPRVVVLVAVLLSILPASAGAVVLITSPTPGQRLAAAPDYATEVLGNPWDMSDRDDYSRYEPGENLNFASLGLDGQGRLMGTPASSDTNLGLLYRGFYGAVNPGLNGRNFPISPTSYSKIAFKLVSTVAGEEPQVYWYHYPHSHPVGADAFGGYYEPGNKTVAGAKIFVFDLASGNVGQAGQEWTAGPVLGLRIDPTSTSAAIGQQVGLDWVRLVPGDANPAAPTLPISWTGPPDTYTLTVLELGANAADPLTLTTTTSGPNFSWPYGILPPGSYRLTITRNGNPSDNATVDFVVNDPPIVYVTDPDEAGSGDFATDVLQNAWDMNDPADVVEVFNMTDAGTFANGEFTVTSIQGQKGRDSQIWLFENNVTSQPLIDPARYHRLTYRYTLDGGFDVGDGGSVARIFWGTTYNASNRLADTEDIVTWAGTNSYTIDLATLGVGEDQGIEAGGTAAEVWSTNPKRYFRLDPHEGASGRTVHLDDVRLASDDAPDADGHFTIHWQYTDADAGTPPTVSLYFDTDRDPNNGKTLIAGGLSAADGQAVWDTTGVPAGVYQIYAEVTDGMNTTARYATGPIRVGGYPEVCGDCVDNDGNGLIDWEDPACCAQPAALNLTVARFRPGKGGLGYARGRMNINASIGDSAFTAVDPTHEDVTFQFRNASGELICSTSAASHWARKKKLFLFNDPNGVLAGFPRKQTLKVRNGGLAVTNFARLVDVTRFFNSSGPRNDLQLVLRIGNRCAQGTQTLRALPKGRYAYP